MAFFDDFEKAGGREPRIAEYRKDAAKAIDREKKRLARECAKLDPEYEAALAEEGMGSEAEQWPEY